MERQVKRLLEWLEKQRQDYADMEAVLAVEAIVGRPDDDHGRVLNPILDAAYWRKQT